VDNSKTTPQYQWQVLGKSIRGSSHERKGLENQDYFDYTRGPDGELPFCLAVSDGHGSKKHFRSASGSFLAVEKALAALNEFEASASSLPLDKLRYKALEELPRRIFNEWQQAVEADIKNKPLAEDPLFNELSAEQQAIIQADSYIAYGATLLAVLVTSTYILYLQLGDGDIVSVNSFGVVSRPIQQEQGVMIFNETHSLSQENAWQKFEVELIAKYDDIQYFPDLICVSTDGLFNSFADSSGFEKVACDYRQLLVDIGHEAVEASMEETLKRISAGGSGDDITLGILYRQTFPNSITAEVLQQLTCKLQEEQAKHQQEIEDRLKSFERELSMLSLSINNMKQQNLLKQRQQPLLLSVVLLLGTLVGTILTSSIFYFLQASFNNSHPAECTNFNFIDSNMVFKKSSNGNIFFWIVNPELPTGKTIDIHYSHPFYEENQKFQLNEPLISWCSNHD
jgi:Protein phosphatase 2C